MVEVQVYRTPFDYKTKQNKKTKQKTKKTNNIRTGADVALKHNLSRIPKNLKRISKNCNRCLFLRHKNNSKKTVDNSLRLTSFKVYSCCHLMTIVFEKELITVSLSTFLSISMSVCLPLSHSHFLSLYFHIMEKLIFLHLYNLLYHFFIYHATSCFCFFHVEEYMSQ